MATRPSGARRKVKRQIDPDVDRAVSALADAGFSPAAIYRDLERQPAYRGRVPRPRTLQRLVRDLSMTDESAPWRLDATLSPEDARYLLGVLVDVTARSQGRQRALTKAEVERLLAIHRAAPTLSPWATFRLAREYLRREGRQDGTADLEIYLAMAPWRGKQARRDYVTFVAVNGLDIIQLDETPNQEAAS